MSSDGTLPLQLMLDIGAMFHVMWSHEWFSTYASGILGCVHLVDGLAHDIVNVGEVKLSLSSDASYVL